MNYLVCQDWINTSKNHAGMKYLCHELAERYPQEYISICVPDIFNTYITSSNRYIRKIQSIYAQMIFMYKLRRLTNEILDQLQEGDKLYLMEYLELLTPQRIIAEKVKRNKCNIMIYGLVHLVPQKLDTFFPSSKMKKWLEPIDKVLTLGSSLSEYFKDRGVSDGKIATLFHYVDISYYKRSTIRQDNHDVTVIAMGNQMRNISILDAIVKDNLDVKFIICQGVLNMSKVFGQYPNVKLVPFIPEDELKKIMEQSDISLNVMEDTIGSNVIVTSLAMGLAMVVSDVGSIRDYCNEKNAIYCENNNINSFSNAISRLMANKVELSIMQEESLLLSDRFSIERFHQLISENL